MDANKVKVLKDYLKKIYSEDDMDKAVDSLDDVDDDTLFKFLIDGIPSKDLDELFTAETSAPDKFLIKKKYGVVLEICKVATEVLRDYSDQLGIDNPSKLKYSINKDFRNLLKNINTYEVFDELKNDLIEYISQDNSNPKKLSDIIKKFEELKKDRNTSSSSSSNSSVSESKSIDDDIKKVQNIKDLKGGKRILDSILSKYNLDPDSIYYRPLIFELKDKTYNKSLVGHNIPKNTVFKFTGLDDTKKWRKHVCNGKQIPVVKQNYEMNSYCELRAITSGGGYTFFDNGIKEMKGGLSYEEINCWAIPLINDGILTSNQVNRYLRECRRETEESNLMQGVQVEYPAFELRELH